MTPNQEDFFQQAIFFRRCCERLGIDFDMSEKGSMPDSELIEFANALRAVENVAQAKWLIAGHPNQAGEFLKDTAAIAGLIVGGAIQVKSPVEQKLFSTLAETTSQFGKFLRPKNQTPSE